MRSPGLGAEGGKRPRPRLAEKGRHREVGRSACFAFCGTTAPQCAATVPNAADSRATSCFGHRWRRTSGSYSTVSNQLTLAQAFHDPRFADGLESFKRCLRKVRVRNVQNLNLLTRCLPPFPKLPFDVLVVVPLHHEYEIRLVQVTSFKTVAGGVPGARRLGVEARLRFENVLAGPATMEVLRTDEEDSQDYVRHPKIWRGMSTLAQTSRAPGAAVSKDLVFMAETFSQFVPGDPRRCRASSRASAGGFRVAGPVEIGMGVGDWSSAGPIGLKHRRANDRGVREEPAWDAAPKSPVAEGI